MAKASTAKKDSKRSDKGSRKTGTAVVRASSSSRSEGRGKSDGFDASDAFIKLLQSPLVAELVAVAATAALAALAEKGYSTNGSRRGRAGNAVKAAGKAAAAAVGRRLSTEMDEIRAAATASRGDAAA
jgi:hypothetical protein